MAALRASGGSTALLFVSPVLEAVLGGTSVEVEVRLGWGDGPFPRGVSLAALRKLEVALLCDGASLGVARFPGAGALRYVASLDLSRAPEGRIELVATPQGTKIVGIDDSSPLALTVDRSGPVIDSVFPSQGVVIAVNDFRAVLVRVSDPVSGLAVERCAASIDDRPLGVPLERSGGLMFEVGEALALGRHALAVRAEDRAGNATTGEYEFEIGPARVADDGARLAEELTAARQRLRDDRAYQERMLEEPSRVLAELRLPYASRVLAAFPSPLPREQAAFLLDADPFAGERVFARLEEPIRSAAADHPTIARFRAMIGEEGALTADRSLTAGARAALSAILQDPAGLFRDFGVELLDSERRHLPPAFPALHADAFAEWISMLVSRRAPAPAEAPPAPTESIERASASLRDYVDPVGSFRERHPDASARQLASLPRPLSYREARQRLAKPTPPDR